MVPGLVEDVEHREVAVGHVAVDQQSKMWQWAGAATP